MPHPTRFHTDRDAYLERALTGYARCHGEDAPQPSRADSYELDYGGQHYILLARGPQVLSVYRLARGSLRLLLYWPRGLRSLHHDRSRVRPG